MRLKSDLTLLFVAAVWGSGFVAQRFAATRMSAFYFNGGRFLLGVLILLVLTRFRFKFERKMLLWAGLAGVLLFAASWLQQAGLATTTIGNASFITGLYVVLVPVFLSLFWKERPSWLAWVSVVLAAAGVMLLSLQDHLKIAPGDALELAGAVMWALHVILISKVSGRFDSVRFTIGQFMVCGLLSMGFALTSDLGGVAALRDTWVSVLYSAIFPISMGFTLQVVGQKGAPAVDAAIILSMEAVFGGLFGYLFFQELMNPQQLAGCALIMAAIILTQIKR